MPSNYQITEERITDEINAFHNGDYTNPTAAARAFGVSAKTVHRRLDGGASKSSRLPSNKALSLEQEQALRDYILDPDKPMLLTDPDSREYITSVESISGGGKTIPPMLILCGIQILEKWAQENDLDDDILLATSLTGYSNDELALQWLKHFKIHSRKSQVGVWRLLIDLGWIRVASHLRIL